MRFYGFYGFVTFDFILMLLIVKIFLQFSSTDYKDFSSICQYVLFYVYPKFKTKIRPLLHAEMPNIHYQVYLQVSIFWSDCLIFLSFFFRFTESINFCLSPQVYGGWLHFELSKREKHSEWAIKYLHKKGSRGMLKHIPLCQ